MRIASSAPRARPGEHQAQRVGGADQAREALGRAEMRHRAALELRDRETSGGNRDANVGGHREFQTFVESVAVDDRDGRLREHGERFDQARIDGVVEADAERRSRRR